MVAAVVGGMTFSGAESHSSRPRTTCRLFSSNQSADVRALTKWLCLPFSFSCFSGEEAVDHAEAGGKARVGVLLKLSRSTPS